MKNDYSDYLSVPEIDLELWIQSRNRVEEVTLTSSMKEAFHDEKAVPVLNYLLIILPLFLKAKYDCTIDKAVRQKLIGTEQHYDKYLDPFINSLEDFGYMQAEQLGEKLNWHKMPFSAETWLLLLNAIYLHRTKIKQSITPQAWKTLRSVFGLMVAAHNQEPLNKEVFQTLCKESRNIHNKLLARWLQTVDFPKKGETKPKNPKAASSVELKEAKKSVDAITKKYFKTDEPSAEELKDLQEKNPEKYKEYRKTVLAVKKAAKKVLEEAFEKHDYKIIDVDTARDLLMRLGIPDPIDENFIGKVGLGTTQSMLFTYYTIFGKKLSCVVGKNVKMNPKYNEKDDTYYCTHLPFISKKGVPIKVYSEDHWKQSKEKLYNGLRECLPVLEDVRSNFSSTVKPILNGKFDNVAALAALVMKVISETAGRIGNAGSVDEHETFGIHNLQVRHIKITKAGASLKYIGKKGVPQEHLVRDPVSVKCISKLIEDRGKEDYVFSKDGERPVSPTSIAEYLKSTGFPASPHMFRKIWAAKIFNTEALKKIPEGRKVTPKEAKEIWNAAIEAVAKKLGQTEKGTSVRSYIDPSLMMAFWTRVGQKPPKTVQDVYDKMALQDPNKEED
ncbi:MAG: hypothetical protein K2N48_08405 [Muribaculaceae bacterium]|nr:hypothetical protein [Muribaculaceae bacterium]